MRKTRASSEDLSAQERQYRIVILRAVLHTLLLLTVLYALLSVFIKENPTLTLQISLVELVVYGGLLWLAERGHVQGVSITLMTLLWLLLFVVAAISGGVAGIGYASMIGLTLAMGLLLGSRAAFVGAGASLLAGLGLYLAEQGGILPAPLLDVGSVAHWGEVAINLTVAALFLHVAERSVTQAQQALQRSSEQLRLTLRAARVGAWEWRIPTNEVHWSDNVEYLFGLAPGSFNGTYEAYLALVHPDDVAVVEEAIARTLEADAPYWVEHRILWPDGSVHWLLGQGELIRDAEGRPLRLLGTVTDVTPQREAQSALRESEARYRAIVESTNDLICRFLPDTTLTFVNEAYCLYFGKRRDELLGRPFLELIPESDHPGIQAAIQQVIQERRPRTYEHKVITPSGELRWQRWTDQPLFDERGEIVELQSVGRDTTEEHLALEALEASLREKEALLKEVHHRVKNNLQIVSSLLKLQAAQLTDPVARIALQESRQRISSMAMIHEKLYRSANLARIDFGAYTREMMAQLARSYGAAGQGIQFQVDIAQVHLNVEQAIPCGLIINELVTNALKHAFPTGQGGTIRVAMQADAECCVLTVTDDGVGLPPNLDINQVDSLGLQLVRTLTEQLNGSLEIASQDGAAFTVRFPEE